MEEEEDDTHLCLKCRATITGLEQYVQHRRAGCPPRHGQQLRADDFFSSLELRSSANRAAQAAAAQASASSPAAAASNERAGRDTDEEEEEEEYSDGEDLADPEAPPRGHTGGKWRPAAWAGPSPPPPSFTGGKWKPHLSPQEQPPPSPTHHHETSGSSSSTSGRWPETEQPKEEHQQQGRSRQEVEEEEDEEDRGPPPGHTSGKWVPGGRAVRKQGSTVQYWCGACCRRLSSRALYQRHLQSELHFKRTLLERQLEASHHHQQLQPQPQRPRAKRVVRRTAAYINSHLWAPSKRRRLQEEADRQAASQAVASSSPPPPAANTDQKVAAAAGQELRQQQQQQQQQRRRQRQKRLAQCDACRARLPRHQWGQHLLSHYHWQRGAAAAPHLHRQLVLRHMPAIVRLAPFRCQPCRFYFNTAHDLEQHILSIEHHQCNLKLQGDYWCSLCRASCDSPAELLCHLRSQAHAELVAAAAGSLAVELRRRRLPSCADCGRRFQLRVQLLAHARRQGHLRALRLAQRLATPFLRDCADCGQRCHSWTDLQRHVKEAHGRETFFCSACSLEFGSSSEALAHRRSSQHRHTAIRRLAAPRRCPYCVNTLQGLTGLQQHIRDVHPNLMSVCAMCGMKFALAQQLARHVRDKACTFPAAAEDSQQEQQQVPAAPAGAAVELPQQPSEGPQQLAEEAQQSEGCDSVSTTGAAEAEAEDAQEPLKPHACDQCPYRCSTRVDLLFHKVLHSAPARSQVQCPECGLSVSRRSLRPHLRAHTGERPARCECGAQLSSRAALLAHQQRVHGQLGAAAAAAAPPPCPVCGFRAASAVTMRRHARRHAPRPRNFVCSKCAKAFYDKTTLQQHEKVHSGKPVACDHAGCVYRCRSLSELAFHRRTHSDERAFHCDACHFSTKTKSQLVRHVKMHLNERAHRCPHCPFSSRVSSHLRRHMRVHTGAKPFRCPHCAFSCSSLENLRKHVLSTSKHQGKCMYQCHLCDFGCNLASDFRGHLVQAHPNAFPDSECAASYATGIYQRDDDPLSVEQPLEPQPRRRRTVAQAPPAEQHSGSPTTVQGSADNLEQLTAQSADPEVSSAKSETVTLHTRDQSTFEPKTELQSQPKKKRQSSTPKSVTTTSQIPTIQKTLQTQLGKQTVRLVTTATPLAPHPVGRQLTQSVPAPLQISPLSIQIPMVPLTTQVQPKIAIPAVRNSTTPTAQHSLVRVAVPQLQTVQSTTPLLVRPPQMAFILSQPANLLQTSTASLQPSPTGGSPALVTVRAAAPASQTPSLIQVAPSVICARPLQLAPRAPVAKAIRPLPLSSAPGTKPPLIAPANISPKAQTQGKYTTNIVVTSRPLQNAVRSSKPTGKSLQVSPLGVTLQTTDQSSVTATTSHASLATQPSGTPSDHRSHITQPRIGVTRSLTTVNDSEPAGTASTSETPARSSNEVEGGGAGGTEQQR